MYQKVEFNKINPTLGELEQAGIPIFNDWWNTYIPEYKDILIRKILHAYHFYQIGQETPNRFVYTINSHLEQIMPYYNKLYESELIKINPLLNHSITNQGRNIENIVNHTNSIDDKFSKSIRDFTGMTNSNNTQTNNLNTLNTAHSTTDKNGNFSEDAGETEKENIDKTTFDTMKQQEVEEKTQTTTNNIDDTTTNHSTVSTDKTVTEKPGDTSVKKMDWGQTETTKDVVVAKDVIVADGTKNWDETLNDHADTSTTTNLVEKTLNSSQQDFSDTPQTKLSSNSSEIRKDYLTNVTWNDGTSNHTADTTQKVDFTDDQTKKHEENYTDNSTTDKNSTNDINKNKGGSDTETTTRSGENVTTTDSTETTDGTSKRIANNVEQLNGNTTTDTDREDNGTENIDRDKTKNEKRIGSNTELDNTDSTSENKQTGTVKNNGDEKTREVSDVSQAQSSINKREKQQTTDIGTTTTTSGFMNVSSSALLEAFRKTFINIDKMIIDELKEDFLLVY